MTGKKHISGLFLILSFFVSATLTTIGGVNAQNSSSSISNIKLPTIYQNKLDDFLANNTVMKDNDAKNYTLNFVIKEIESDRGISKENQLLFIYCAIGYNFSQDFYTGDDGDDNRMLEFEKAMDSIENCQTKYKNEFISYMQQRSADAQQRSADAQQRSADAQQRSADAQQRSADAQQEAMKLDSLGLKEIHKFYTNFKNNPNIVKDYEIQQAKKVAKDVIQNCKKYGINYRVILLKEVGGDAKKVDEILKFYGVE